MLVITRHKGFQNFSEDSTYHMAQKNKIYFFNLTCDLRILNEVSC
jgi:hypothetical protein